MLTYSIYGRMRILITCLNFRSLTGSEMYVLEISKQLVKRGHEVTVYSYLGDGFLAKKAKGIKCIPFGSPIDETQYDIIHAQHYSPTKYVLSKTTTIPVVCTIHSEIIEAETPVIDDRISSYICIRPSIEKHLWDNFEIARTKTEVIYNPINTNEFKPIKDKDRPNRRIVLFVGTVDYLRIETINYLIKEAKEEGHILYVVGNNDNKLLDVSNLPPNIRVHKWTENIVKYYHLATETAGIMLGRTTIEGWLTGIRGRIFDVDKNGKILSIEQANMPNELHTFDSKVVAERIEKIYNKTLQTQQK